MTKYLDDTGLAHFKSKQDTQNAGVYLTQAAGVKYTDEATKAETIAQAATGKFVSPKRLFDYSNWLATESVVAKQIHNLAQAQQGKLQETQTDSTSAYTKTVVAGALDYARLTQWGGKSFVWNQLVQNGNFASTTNWFAQRGTLTASNNELTYTVTEIGASIIANRLAQSVATHVGKKYYVCASLYSASSSGRPSLVLAPASGTGVTMSSFDSVANQWNFLESVISPANESTAVWIGFDCQVGYAVGDTVKVKNMMCIDLTAMFGAGNEPATAEAFRAMFPASYYAYTSSAEVMSACLQEVETTSTNLFTMSESRVSSQSATAESNNERVFYKNAIASTATAVAVSNVLYAENGHPSFVFLNIQHARELSAGDYRLTVYSDSTTSNKAYVVVAVFSASDAGKTISQLGTGQHHTFSSSGSHTYNLTATSENKYLIVFISNVNDQSAPDGFTLKFQLDKGTTATPWVSPFTETVQIPSEIKAMNGYGYGTPAYWNGVEFAETTANYYERVARVDLGTLPWTRDGTTGVFSSSGIATDALPTQTNRVAPVVIQKYTIVSKNNVGSTDKSFAMSQYGGLLINDTTYSTAEELKASLSGVYLYYNKKIPVITDVSSYMPSNALHVCAGSTIKFKNQLTNMLIPIPSTVKYEVSINDAIFQGGS